MKTMAIVCLLGVGVVCTPRPTMCVTMSIVTVTAYHTLPRFQNPRNYCLGEKGKDGDHCGQPGCGEEFESGFR